MSRRPVARVPRSPRRTRSPHAALLTLALVSACGTGLHSRTYQEHGNENGAAADVGGAGGIAVRNLHIQLAGSDAFVVGGLVNNGAQPDSLVGASTDVSSTAALTIGGTPANAVPIPSLGAAPQSWALQLSGLTTTLQPATYVGLTLDFAHAGRITLQVPVYAGDNGLASRSTQQNPYGEK